MGWMSVLYNIESLVTSTVILKIGLLGDNLV